MDPVRLAVAGVGNNASALLQGTYYYQSGTAADDLLGLRSPQIGGLGAGDVKFTTAFDVDDGKVGLDLADAALRPPNNYPRLAVPVPHQGVAVERGFGDEQEVAADHKRIVELLVSSEAEVLLYSLPTGMQWALNAYVEAALEAGVAFVNCTPELAARDAVLLERYRAAGLPLIGDDLAGHLGASVVHRALLRLVVERGISIDGSYQVNIGGNEDFRNLHVNGASKRISKLNALASDDLVEQSKLTVVPSAGYVPHLGDEKVAFISIDGSGWGGTRVSLEVKLRVQDSSNAAGVIIDLVRIAALARRRALSGFVAAAAPLLKSPPEGTAAYSPDTVAESLDSLASE